MDVNHSIHVPSQVYKMLIIIFSCFAVVLFDRNCILKPTLVASLPFPSKVNPLE